MKNVLAENMLRFGTKNLTESQQRLLVEQSLEAPMLKIYPDLKAFKSILLTSIKNGDTYTGMYGTKAGYFRANADPTSGGTWLVYCNNFGMRKYADGRYYPDFVDTALGEYAQFKYGPAGGVSQFYEDGSGLQNVNRTTGTLSLVPNEDATTAEAIAAKISEHFNKWGSVELSAAVKNIPTIVTAIQRMDVNVKNKLTGVAKVVYAAVPAAGTTPAPAPKPAQKN